MGHHLVGTDGQMNHFCWQEKVKINFNFSEYLLNKTPQTTSKNHFRESSFELLAFFPPPPSKRSLPQTVDHRKKKAPRTNTLSGTLVTHWNGHLLPTPQHCFDSCFLETAEQTCVRAMQGIISGHSPEVSPNVDKPNAKLANNRALETVWNKRLSL